MVQIRKVGIIRRIADVLWSVNTRVFPYILFMFEVKDLIKISLEAGRESLRQSRPTSTQEKARRQTPILVPVRSLGENHRGRIKQHLLLLSPEDRYLRFGFAAQDVHIEKYVEGLHFERDEIFGIYNRKLELLAVAHLAYAKEPLYKSCAEFGVSVLASARGRGYGARMFERAAMHATNDGISVMFIHALSENAAMLKIARNAGARVERDGMESEAYLQLPKATLDTRVAELIEERVAQTDYQIKLQAKNFRNFLSNVQKLRHDAAEAQSRHPH